MTPNSEPCSSLRSLIDQHYGCVAMKAVKTDPHDLVVPDDALKSFEDHFEFVEFLIFADFLFNVSNTLMSSTSIELFFLTTEVTTVSPRSFQPFQPFRLSLAGLLWHLLGACIEEGCSSCVSSSFSCEHLSHLSHPSLSLGDLAISHSSLLFFVFLVCAVVFFRFFFAIFNDLLDFEKRAVHEHSVKQDLICNAKQAMKRRKWAQV